MRSATQLARIVAYFQNTHRVAVFLTKQSGYSISNRLLVLGDVGSHRDVGEYSTVDFGLDLANLLLRQWPRIGEVKPQPVGRNKRSRLQRVRPDIHMKRLVQ